jgi:stalled ribosome alternative rescue factor ArfA
MKPQYKKVRTLVQFNTGTRIHKAKKGKGSYKRIKKVKE